MQFVLGAIDRSQANAHDLVHLKTKSGRLLGYHYTLPVIRKRDALMSSSEGLKS